MGKPRQCRSWCCLDGFTIVNQSEFGASELQTISGFNRDPTLYLFAVDVRSIMTAEIGYETFVVGRDFQLGVTPRYRGISYNDVAVGTP